MKDARDAGAGEEMSEVAAAVEEEDTERKTDGISQRILQGFLAASARFFAFLLDCCRT